MITLSDVEEANEQWFDSGNKKFFGDIQYMVLQGKETKKYFLVRETNAWTDMFGEKKKPHWRINELNQETLKIGHLIDDILSEYEDVKDWLKEN